MIVIVKLQDRAITGRGPIQLSIRGSLASTALRSSEDPKPMITSQAAFQQEGPGIPTSIPTICG